MARPQRTVGGEGEVSGVGLHSGERTTLRVAPAEADHGVVFVRTDLAGSPRVRADADHLGVRQRRTALVAAGGAEVHTVEHFLACCTGLGIDNLLVTLDGPECPGMDGSAAEFAALLQGLGARTLDKVRPTRVVTAPVTATAGPGQALVAIAGGEGLSVSYTLDYGSSWVGRQAVSLAVTPERFCADVAGARTFCLAAEAEALREAGLGKGATYANTLVIGDEGVIENEPRWPDEFARHKLLDLLGDLFLVGADVVGHVHAYRTGHAANLSLVRALASGPPPEEGPLGLGSPAMTHAQIRRILPHRYPFLLIDRVI